MEINRIDHISIAVANLEQARQAWEPILGKSAPDDAYTNSDEKIKVARYRLGEVNLELMESTSPDGEVAKFIRKRGEGVMLVSLNVANTRESLADLTSKSIPIIGEARPFFGSEYAFIHPKAVNGVLLEIIDDKRSS